MRALIFILCVFAGLASSRARAEGMGALPAGLLPKPGAAPAPAAPKADEFGDEALMLDDDGLPPLKKPATAAAPSTAAPTAGSLLPPVGGAAPAAPTASALLPPTPPAAAPANPPEKPGLAAAPKIPVTKEPITAPPVPAPAAPVIDAMDDSLLDPAADVKLPMLPAAPVPAPAAPKPAPQLAIPLLPLGGGAPAAAATAPAPATNPPVVALPAPAAATTPAAAPPAPPKLALPPYAKVAPPAAGSAAPTTAETDRATASAGVPGEPAPMLDRSAFPEQPSGGEVAVILSNNRFFPSAIRLRTGQSTKLVFTTVNKRPAALIIERLQVQRWVARDEKPPESNELDRVRWELNREVSSTRITEVILNPGAGIYSFHDALTGARGEILVE